MTDSKRPTDKNTGTTPADGIIAGVDTRRSMVRKAWVAAIICLAVIAIDQLIKIWVKTTFYWGEDREIFSWFHLRFIQNNGMAFGMEMGSKLFLTLFRIVVVVGATYFIYKLIRRPGSKVGLIVCVSLIVAGALGNIIDCVFYGEIFDNPMPPQVAQFVPWGQGYAEIFHGMVVDMFYFPLCQWVWPDWLPWIGGREFTFFDPVFNFADAAINVGFFGILFFYAGHFNGKDDDDKSADSSKKVKAKDN